MNIEDKIHKHLNENRVNLPPPSPKAMSTIHDIMSTWKANMRILDTLLSDIDKSLGKLQYIPTESSLFDLGAYFIKVYNQGYEDGYNAKK